jgi:rhodanese-related sulfurtransferase
VVFGIHSIHLYQSMSVELAALELSEWLQSENPPLLLDVREVDEHKFVALPDSKLIPLGELPARVAEIAEWKDRDVLVYCHHGIRSLHAIRFLRGEGFSKLRNLSGGIHAWACEVDPEMKRY